MAIPSARRILNVSCPALMSEVLPADSVGCTPLPVSHTANDSSPVCMQTIFPADPTAGDGDATRGGFDRTNGGDEWRHLTREPQGCRLLVSENLDAYLRRCQSLHLPDQSVLNRCADEICPSQGQAPLLHRRRHDLFDLRVHRNGRYHPQIKKAFRLIGEVASRDQVLTDRAEFRDRRPVPGHGESNRSRRIIEVVRDRHGQSLNQANCTACAMDNGVGKLHLWLQMQANQRVRAC